MFFSFSSFVDLQDLALRFTDVVLLKFQAALPQKSTNLYFTWSHLLYTQQLNSLIIKDAVGPSQHIIIIILLLYYVHSIDVI